jgi:uncharacterized protein (TIGR00730 family)
VAHDDSEDERLQAIMGNPSYRLAYLDWDFISREDLRPLRLELELLKPQMILEARGIKSTVVVFGGTQIRPREEADAILARAEADLNESPGDKQLRRNLDIARKLVDKSRFYDDCRKFSNLVSNYAKDHFGEFIVKTGGGPGIMEAGNRGAWEAGADSIGLNIILPFEQTPNSYVTPGLCFQFNYFSIRKMHFLLRAKALVCFPGGFGTLDELFTTLTLRQTGRMQAVPIIMYGREYWSNALNFQFLADEGVIQDEHLELVNFAETPEEAWDLIRHFHGLD